MNINVQIPFLSSYTIHQQTLPKDSENDVESSTTPSNRHEGDGHNASQKNESNRVSSGRTPRFIRYSPPAITIIITRGRKFTFASNEIKDESALCDTNFVS